MVAVDARPLRLVQALLQVGGTSLAVVLPGPSTRTWTGRPCRRCSSPSRRRASASPPGTTPILLKVWGAPMDMAGAGSCYQGRRPARLRDRWRRPSLPRPLPAAEALGVGEGVEPDHMGEQDRVRCAEDRVGEVQARGQAPVVADSQLGIVTSSCGSVSEMSGTRIVPSRAPTHFAIPDPTCGTS